MPHAILKQSLTFTIFLLYSYKAMKLLIHVIIKINRHLLGTDCFDFSEIFSRKYVQHILTKMPDK